jgi:hypothetical protein
MDRRTKQLAYKTACLRMLQDCIDVGSRTRNEERRKTFAFIAAVGLRRLLDGGVDVESILAWANCPRKFRALLKESILLKGRLQNGKEES